MRITWRAALASAAVLTIGALAACGAMAPPATSASANNAQTTMDARPLPDLLSVVAPITDTEAAMLQTASIAQPGLLNRSELDDDVSVIYDDGTQNVVDDDDWPSQYAWLKRLVRISHDLLAGEAVGIQEPVRSFLYNRMVLVGADGTVYRAFNVEGDRLVPNGTEPVGFVFPVVRDDTDPADTHSLDDFVSLPAPSLQRVTSTSRPAPTTSVTVAPTTTNRSTTPTATTTSQTTSVITTSVTPSRAVATTPPRNPPAPTTTTSRRITTTRSTP